MHWANGTVGTSQCTPVESDHVPRSVDLIGSRGVVAFAFSQLEPVWQLSKCICKEIPPKLFTRYVSRIRKDFTATALNSLYPGALFSPRRRNRVAETASPISSSRRMRAERLIWLSHLLAIPADGWRHRSLRRTTCRRDRSHRDRFQRCHRGEQDERRHARVTRSP